MKVHRYRGLTVARSRTLCCSALRCYKLNIQAFLMGGKSWFHDLLCVKNLHFATVANGDCRWPQLLIPLHRLFQCDLYILGLGFYYSSRFQLHFQYVFLLNGVTLLSKYFFMDGQPKKIMQVERSPMRKVTFYNYY